MTRALRVVYVSTLTHGGPVSHLLDLAPRIAEAGADVRVVCGTDEVAERFRAVGLRADVLVVRSKWDVMAVGRLWRLLADADVIHTQDRRAGLFARPLGRLRGAAAVHTYHGLPEDIAVRVGRDEPPSAPELGRARRLWLFGCYLPLEGVLARLGVVVVPSQAMSSYLASVGLPPRRLVVIPSGIDASENEPRPAVPEGGPLRVVTVANLEPWKGVDLVVDACARATVARGIVLDVFGDGTERAALERSAARQGVDAHFHGHVPDIRQRLSAADLFVLASRAENLPISILEAMAGGLPVVAARVGGVAELVEDAVTGRVVPPDDAAALAGAISDLADDPGRRAAMGRAGLDRVRAQFSASGAAARTLELYGARCASSR